MHLGLIIGKGKYTYFILRPHHPSLARALKVQGGKSLGLNTDYRV